MNFIQITLASILGGTIPLLVAGFLAKKWIENRISQSIKHVYDRKLEGYKIEVKRKEQAAIVAEAIAEWAANPTEIEDIKRLQKLVWEATLWLPDDLAADFNNMLAHHGKTPKEVLIAIKSHLWGKASSLLPQDIVHFELQPKIKA